MSQYSEDGQYDLIVDPYATLDDGGTWYDEDKDPVDLTGATAIARFRSAVDSATVQLECSSANGRIVLGGVNGTFDFNVTPAQTQSLQDGWVYDLYITLASGRVIRALWGKVIIKKKSVTRP